MKLCPKCGKEMVVSHKTIVSKCPDHENLEFWQTYLKCPDEECGVIMSPWED